MQRRIAAFASVVELATGVALLLDPALVVRWLLGQEEMSGIAVPLGRCFGAALLALGLACLPQRKHTAVGAQAAHALLLYNTLIALYLGYLGAMTGLGGLLLWPAVALHAVVALSLAWTLRANLHAGVSTPH